MTYLRDKVLRKMMNTGNLRADNRGVPPDIRKEDYFKKLKRSGPDDNALMTLSNA